MFLALDKQTGKILWQYDIKEDGAQTSFHGDPVIYEDLFIIATDGSQDDGNTTGYIYAFDMKTGEVRWKDKSAGVPTDVTEWKSNLYGVTHKDEVLCLNRETGQVNWSFNPTHSDSPYHWRSLGVSGDRIYFAGADTVIYALNAETGDVLWKRRMPDRISSSVTAVKDAVYLGTDDGYLHVLNTDSGDIKNSMYVSEPPTGGLVVTGERILFLAGEKTLNCLDLGLTKTHWWQDSDQKWTSPKPFLWGDRVVIGDEDGQVFAFSQDDGGLLWRGFVDGVVRSIGSEDDILFVGTFEGGLFALKPHIKD